MVLDELCLYKGHLISQLNKLFQNLQMKTFHDQKMRSGEGEGEKWSKRERKGGINNKLKKTRVQKKKFMEIL